MERPGDHALGELTLARPHHVHNAALGHAHAVFDQRCLHVRHGRRGARVEGRDITGIQPAGDVSEAVLLLVPTPHGLRLARIHLRRCGPDHEPAPVVARQRQRDHVVAERQDEGPVQRVVGVEALAVHDQIVGRGCDNRLQPVRQRPALPRLRLLQLVQQDHFAFQSVAPLAVDRVPVDQPPVDQRRAADRPHERRPHGVLAAAAVAAVQDRVVDLHPRVLDLERHHVPDVVKVSLVRHQPPAMVQPARYVAARRLRHVRPGVDPAVAVDLAVARHQHTLASGVGHTHQDAGAHRLAVLVVAGAGLNLLPAVDGLAGDVAEQGVEGVPANLPPIQEVEIAVVRHDVGEPLVPARLLDPAQLLAVHLRDDIGRPVRERLRRRQLVERAGHLLCQQLIPQAVAGAGAALVADPFEEGGAVQMLAMAVVAAEGAVDRAVAGLALAGGMLCRVRADNAQPAFLVGRGQD